MQSIKLAIVTPVYNEEEVIELFYRNTLEVLKKLEDVDTSIIFVVDRCTDKTVDILRKLSKSNHDIKVIKLSSRFGHQASLIAGIENALDYDAIIMMDSDLQHPPSLIPEFLLQFKKGFDVVYTIRKDTKGIGNIRKNLGNIFYYLLDKLAIIPINSNASDFRLISQRTARVLVIIFKEQNIFLRGLFPWIGFNQIGIEYTAEERSGGYSKYSVTRMLRLGLIGLLSFSTKPLQMGIFTGIIFAMLAFILIIVAIIRYFIVHALPSGWTTMALLLLLFSGIQLMFLGIIALYIGGIHEEVKKRPRYIIDEIF